MGVKLEFTALEMAAYLTGLADNACKTSFMARKSREPFYSPELHCDWSPFISYTTQTPSSGCFSQHHQTCKWPNTRSPHCSIKHSHRIMRLTKLLVLYTWVTITCHFEAICWHSNCISPFFISNIAATSRRVHKAPHCQNVMHMSGDICDVQFQSQGTFSLLLGSYKWNKSNIW